MGILDGLRVVELGGLGPSAWACTFLSDMGAQVVRIDRPGRDDINFSDSWMRGRSRIELDLKHPPSRALVRDLVRRADVVVESFRPGVAERLGLGPTQCRHDNPRLVYGRMTGWGQDGPYADRAGHDINYMSISGVLATIGEKGGRPVPPLYYTGDWASGTMLLLSGLLGALYERERSGAGQVVDASILDGAAMMLLQVMSLRDSGAWTDDRGSNDLDGGIWFYDTYETSDGRFMAVGAFEPKFRRTALRTLGLPDDEGSVLDPTKSDSVRADVASVFRSRTQLDWERVFGDVDACVTPVRSLAEVADEPHHVARQTYTTSRGRTQASPAPRFSRTPSTIADRPDTTAVVAAWGVTLDELDLCTTHAQKQASRD